MLHLAGFDINAVSVAGMDTCIELPRLKIAFDIGHGPRSAVGMNTILFTHAHIDHMGGVAHHAATRSLLGMSPPTYVVPPGIAEPLETLMEAFRTLDGSDLPCTIVERGPGQEIAVGKRLIARPFASYHPVISQGYTLYEQRSRLRSDLHGQPREVIAAARERGEEVGETIEIPTVVFSGDTTIEIVDKEATVRTAKLLIMEVSFLDERVSVESARTNGHIHLDEVVERADLFENEAILFTHLSARYRQDEAEEILAKRLPASLKDRVTLLPRPAWCP